MVQWARETLPLWTKFPIWTPRLRLLPYGFVSAEHYYMGWFLIYLGLWIRWFLSAIVWNVLDAFHWPERRQSLCAKSFKCTWHGVLKGREETQWWTHYTPFGPCLLQQFEIQFVRWLPLQLKQWVTVLSTDPLDIDWTSIQKFGILVPTWSRFYYVTAFTRHSPHPSIPSHISYLPHNLYNSLPRITWYIRP